MLQAITLLQPRTARKIAGIENRHFTFFMECQFVDDEELELLSRPGHTTFCFCLLTKRLASASEVSEARASGEDVISGGSDERCVV
jgi:hypothetical protein